MQNKQCLLKIFLINLLPHCQFRKHCLRLSTHIYETEKLCCPPQLLRFSQSRGLMVNNAGSAGGREAKSQGTGQNIRGIADAAQF